MNLYNSKQRWKITLLVIAIVMVGASLYVSHSIVKGVSQRERDKAKQWADAIKKKVELVQLTNNTFQEVRNLERQKIAVWIEATKEISKETPLDVIPDYTFPFKIINENKDIPVILLDDANNLSSYINLDFDTSIFRSKFPIATKKEITKHFEDSLVHLALSWKKKNLFFSVEVYKGLLMTYYYDDSKGLKKLENDRDALITAFNQELIANKSLIPVLLIDSVSHHIIGTNFDKKKLSVSKIKNTIKELKKVNTPIVIDFNDGNKNILFFDESPELKQLKYFPYIQFSIIGLFVLIGYIIFSTFRKAEQNQVWAGMAKETAHQLGTPLSSLMAWVQLLETYQIDPMVAEEMSKDVERLSKVTDRFSKIGSIPNLEDENITLTVKNVLDYLQRRFSDKVELDFHSKGTITAKHNGPLMEWVIENICKNAVDAMSGKGKLTVTMHQTPEWVHIDIQDTGKGISPKQIKTVFQPGFTTKTRGWGLGLTLVKRIIKEYHKGKVYVLDSQINIGTTFRISLPL
ncbi:MAG: HAMP domain-containing histidine kinase [Flavobacteriia bacterium]|nr:HAMP domain-containing histidine kinase [Flavobacteriia bacterium]